MFRTRSRRVRSGRPPRRPSTSRFPYLPMFPTPAGPGTQRVLGDRRRALVRTWPGPEEAALEVTPLGSDAGPVLLRVRPALPPVISFAPMDRARWSMAGGVPARRGGADVFADFLDCIAKAVLFGPGFERGLERDAEAAAEWMRSARTAVRDMAIHAVTLCDPEALFTARRFPTCMRWWLYTKLVLDGTGRIQQLTESAPGVLGFAFALGESVHFAHLADLLLGGVVRARPLNALLGEVLDGWLEAVPGFAANCSEGGRLPWSRVMEASGRDRDALLDRQRLLLRRASPLVPPTLLLLPPPLAFAPEDIPRTTRANARWFRVMKGTLATLALPPDVDPRIPFAFCRFASRHALDLPLGRGGEDRPHLRRLAEYCIVEGRVPSRRTSPTRLLAEERGWRERLHLRALRVDIAARGHRFEQRLPDASEFDWSGEGLSVVALRTVGEIVREGDRMHHCVANYVEQVLDGRSFLCRVTWVGKPYTLEIRTSLWSTERTAEVLLGACNREPPAALLRALEPWRRLHGLLPSAWWSRTLAGRRS